MLEKGPLILPQYQATTGVSGFRRDEAFSTGAEKILRLDVANKGVPYYSSHVEPDLNDEPHIYRRADGRDDATIEGYTAQVVGGGTQLYGGVSLRFTPRDLTLAQWNNRPGAALDGDPNDEVRREARDWPFPYATLEPYYAKAETLVGINGEVANQRKPFTSGDKYQKPLAYNPISEHVKAGMDRLGHAALPHAARGDHARITRRAAARVRSRARRRRPPTSIATAIRWGSSPPPGCRCSARSRICRTSRCCRIAPSRICRPTVPGSVRCTSWRLTARRVRFPAASSSSPARRSRASACSSCPAQIDPTGFGPRINQDGNGMLGAYFLTHCFGGASALVPSPERYDKSETLDSDFAVRLLPLRRVPRLAAHLGRRGDLQQHLGPRAAAGAGAQLRQPRSRYDLAGLQSEHRS